MDHSRQETEEEREKRLAKMKEYHRDTYANRRDAKNAQTNARRQATNWYEAHKEELKANRKVWYLANKEIAQARMRKHSHELRAEVLRHYGTKCACCGETEPKFLAIDHMNNDGAAHRKEIGKSSQSILYWLRDNNYPEGFQLLCHNCNVAKAYYGICPHQERKA